MTTPELLAALFADPTEPAAKKLNDWLLSSRRFFAFVEANRSKIRKKLRTAVTPESLQSVLLELEVARHFIEDRRCQVEYEQYGQRRARSPDLTVTFRVRTTLQLEVTQIQEPAADMPDWEGKLISVICNKLGQMLPESLNILIIAVEGDALTLEETARAMKRLKERIEQRDTDLLTRFGFADPSGFFKQFQRLNGILVWKSQAAEGEEGRRLWINPQSRLPLPAAIISLVTSCME